MPEKTQRRCCSLSPKLFVLGIIWGLNDYFSPEFGTDNLYFSTQKGFHSSSGFIMILCMSDLVEWEIQRLGASLGVLGWLRERGFCKQINFKLLVKHTGFSSWDVKTGSLLDWKIYLHCLQWYRNLLYRWINSVESKSPGTMQNTSTWQEILDNRYNLNEQGRKRFRSTSASHKAIRDRSSTPRWSPIPVLT